MSTDQVNQQIPTQTAAPGTSPETSEAPTRSTWTC